MNRNHFNLIIWMFILNSFMGISQKNIINANVSDCSGAIQMMPNVLLKPKMPNGPGTVNDLAAYSEKLELLESNSLWFNLELSHSGWLDLNISDIDFPLEYGVFVLNEEEGCAAIYKGKTEIYTHLFQKDIENLIRIDSIQYSKNQEVFLFLNTTHTIATQVSVEAKFTADVSENEYNAMKKVFDLRSSKEEEPYSIKIRDAKTRLPIVSDVIIVDSKTHNAMYTASDIILGYSDNLKMTLEVNANGYFFQDVLINTRKENVKDLIVYLEALEQNQLIELEGLVFESQSHVLIPEAMPKLKRLKDFMLINTEVNIEVQGHVHLEGKNTSKGKKLSKKRAKTVRKALIASGIDKKRITVIGFGNSKMKYPEAETDAEKQANRRVEIKIK